ncbi:MAG: hypothetical protein DCF32_09555 [Leptolyngbya sp.]|nr:MAG: hypothetical protein DCF32_09555 [Leptolyngbya sp.]
MSVLDLNERYYSDSHWFAWIGPRLAQVDTESMRVNAEVERVFQEANKIAECVDRHRRALTAKPAGWSFAEPVGEAEQQLMSQILGWMIPRSARSHMPKHGQEQIAFPNAIAEAVHYRLLGGKGYLRLWQPKRFENAQPWQKVALHAPHPDSVEVERDGDGFPFKISYSYTVDSQNFKEVQEINENGQTEFKIVNQSGDVEPGSEETLDLGGRLTIAILEGRPIVTESVRRLQNGINYVLTLMIRNLQYGGFLRDVIMNGMPPGDYDEAGKFIPDEGGWIEGPGAKLEVSGLPIFDSEGNVTNYTTPSISTRNPVDVEAFLKAYKATSAMVYEAFGQGHVLAADMAVSGVSRIQMRQDFTTSCSEDSEALRVALSDTYACAYLLATQATDPDRALNIIVDPKLAISELSPDEANAIVGIHAARLRSTHSTMALLGVENPEAEIAAIDEESKKRMESAQLNRDMFLYDDADDPDADGGGSDDQQTDEQETEDADL